MRKYIDLRVEANETDLEEFVRVCGAIQYLSAVGANREVRLQVDGDGSADFVFYIDGQKISYTELDTGKKDVFKFYLGE